jgi:uncharacterized damage-inducible protein DinB
MANDTFLYDWGGNKWTGFGLNDSGYYSPVGGAAWDWGTAPDTIRAQMGNRFTPLYKTQYQGRNYDDPNNPLQMWGYSLNQPTVPTIDPNLITGGIRTQPSYNEDNSFNPYDPRTWVNAPEGFDWTQYQDGMQPKPVPPNPNPIGNEPVPPNPNPIGNEPVTPIEQPDETQPIFGDTGNVLDNTNTSLNYQQYTPTSFQYSDAYNNLLNTLSSFNPAYDTSFEPVQWTPEQIQNMYSTQFADLDRQQQLAEKRLSNLLQERFQGRSGQLITGLGDLAYDYGRQRENVMSDVLAKVLAQQEELTQGRQSLAQNEAALRNALYQTGTSLLNTIGGADIAEAGINLQNIQSAMNRTSQGIQDAISIGNFELAAELSQQQMELEQARLNLEQQGQAFNQSATQQQLLGNLLQTLLSYNLGEVSDSTDRWSNYINSLLNQASV